jgi:hypothetical protein
MKRTYSHEYILFHRFLVIFTDLQRGEAEALIPRSGLHTLNCAERHFSSFHLPRRVEPFTRSPQLQIGRARRHHDHQHLLHYPRRRPQQDSS